MRLAPRLTPHHTLALTGVVLVVIAAWAAGAGVLPNLSGDWDVALTAAVLIPGTLLVPWVLLPVTPLTPSKRLALATGAAFLLAIVFAAGGSGSLFTAAKVLAFTLAGLLFLTLFEAVWWVALVALIIPLVDIASVAKGPTKVILEEEPGVFEQVAVPFRLPGEESGALLGPPDFLFFALFLGTAARFGLRRRATWVGMVVGLGLTLVGTVVFDLNGLPALPGVAVGFLAPNLDLLWRMMPRRAVDRT